MITKDFLNIPIEQCRHLVKDKCLNKQAKSCPFWYEDCHVCLMQNLLEHNDKQK